MPKKKWYKGNIHTHTTESDGDSDPISVARWYRQHGYDFLVLSDHNHRTVLNYGKGKRQFKKPLMIPGEEISVRIKNGTIPIHINGIGIDRLVEPIDAEEIVPTLQSNVDAILDAGGIASINHPNFRWAFDHRSIIQVTGAKLMEIYNGHPGTNTYGGLGKFSCEEMWDQVLTAGKSIFGVATDDSHNYHDFEPKRSNPGRGWIVVRAYELSTDSICNALSSGEFYASTGVTLHKLEVSQRSISLEIEKDRFSYIYTTRFTGKNGIILSEIAGTEAEYKFHGDETYVRATVTNSANTKAWVQPVFLE